ncbi:putative S-adenosylmethionine-dependent methyltransferase [Mizugakiibacter sediminis]|uniref:tRNA (guanine(46)-N(7))-methyltransferase n=1 Tax=Mizugakiibacter sediminis TaxID=1475481 RepID=A0A0K8QRH2_9GAMM|nr:methyltransferase domain-containing protein [Mizugakiibacter sediminis]GAP67251.1 putative S-adenosylmethionine-dependent methyltransferase [Mizugakiibacter sediminis]
MFANSRVVASAQQAPHARLEARVRRHLDVPWRRPPAAHNVRAFEALRARIADAPCPLVLDAGCGTGASTLRLAERHRDCWVIGVDKSAARLAVGARLLAAADAPANALLLRAELGDLWRLMRDAGWRLHRHYLLYPNPWPKPAQLARRWHAHPAFAALSALGGTLELRCNWRVYADEFASALRLAGADARAEAFIPADPLTPFERKYAASGHALWRVRARLDADGAG